jgi:type I restriction enzyme R subunit
MVSLTNELALESSIEKRLTGTCLEELKKEDTPANALGERNEIYRGGNGYYIGLPEDFNARFAIDTVRLFENYPEKMNCPICKSPPSN